MRGGTEVGRLICSSANIKREVRVPEHGVPAAPGSPPSLAQPRTDADAPARPASTRGGLRGTVLSLGFLGTSQVAVVLLGFATQVLLARALPPDAFGMFMAVLAAISLMAPLAEFGVSELWLQRFGLEGPGAYRWVRPSVSVVLIGGGLLTVAMLAWSLAERTDPAQAGVRALLSSLIAAQAATMLSASVLQLRGAHRRLASLQVLPHLGRVLVVAVVGWAGLSVVIAAAGYALTALATVAIGVVVMRPLWRQELPLEGHAGPTPASDAPAIRMRNVAAGAGLFALGNVFYLLGLNLGTVVAAEFLDARAAATLAVPMAILMAVYLIPRVVYQQYFLAKLHRWSWSNRDAIVIAYRLGTSAMIALGVVVGLAMALAGPVLIPVVFGEAYAASAGLLAVVALAVPLRFGAASVAALLTSGGLLRRRVTYQGIGAAVYVAALAVATPRWGLPGVASAVVVAEATLLLLFWTAARRHVIAGATLRWADIFRRLREGDARASQP